MNRIQTMFKLLLWGLVAIIAGLGMILGAPFALVLAGNPRNVPKAKAVTNKHQK